MASDWEGVSFAPGDSLLDASPTWVRLDSGVTDLNVASIDIRRGRQSVFEETNTGTCTVTFNDRAGVLDPTNTGSPYYGEILGRPFAVAIRNPVTDAWFPLFRGAIDDIGYGLTPSQGNLETAIVAVDAFDFFANFELIPGLAGFSNAQVNGQGYVFYENADFDLRLAAIFEDCGMARSARRSVFGERDRRRVHLLAPGTALSRPCSKQWMPSSRRSPTCSSTSAAGSWRSDGTPGSTPTSSICTPPTGTSTGGQPATTPPASSTLTWRG